MFKLKCICLIIVLAVSDASDNGLLIGGQLPLGYTFGGYGLGWNNAKVIPTINNGWGWGNPSYSYSYFTGHGWPSTPVIKHIPVTVNAGWAKEPVIFNPGWVKEPVILNPGWVKEPVILNNGWAKAPVILNNGWAQQPVILNNGWGKEPVILNNGWGKGVPLTPWGAAAAIPIYGKDYGWAPQTFPLVTKPLIGGNGWAQSALPFVGIKGVGISQGIPLVGGNGWAESRYAGGYGISAPYYK